MRQVEVVLPLHDVVGIFVAERKADAQHLSLVADDVKVDDLAFLAAIIGVTGEIDRLLRRNQP